MHQPKSTVRFFFLSEFGYELTDIVYLEGGALHHKAIEPYDCSEEIKDVMMNGLNGREGLIKVSEPENFLSELAHVYRGSYFYATLPEELDVKALIESKGKNT